MSISAGISLEHLQRLNKQSRGDGEGEKAGTRAERMRERKLRGKKNKQKEIKTKRKSLEILTYERNSGQTGDEIGQNKQENERSEINMTSVRREVGWRDH